MSRLSMVMLPDVGVKRLKRVRRRELFPLPVRPQRPIFEPAGMEMEILSSVFLSVSSLCIWSALDLNDLGG
jgi:hypothetical protein